MKSDEKWIAPTEEDRLTWEDHCDILKDLGILLFGIGAMLTACFWFARFLG